ncbi:MAG: hypothetical protein ACFB02_00120 [Mastigocoleus sp.]
MLGLVYAWSAHIDEQDLLTGSYKSSREEGDVNLVLTCGNLIGNASSAVIRRSCFDKVGGYNCKLKQEYAQGCEDWDLYLRIAYYYHFRVVPEILVGYRQVIGSMSCDFTQMAKSYYLTMEDNRKRNPHVPLLLYKWSRINFYTYLARKSLNYGNYQSYLYWSYQSIRLDTTELLNKRIYQNFFKSYLKIIFQPITSLIWKDHISWLKFKKKIKSSIKGTQPLKNIDEIRQLALESNSLFSNVKKQDIFKKLVR